MVYGGGAEGVKGNQLDVLRMVTLEPHIPNRAILPIHLVQTTLGHSSVATAGHYLHARPSVSSARYLRV